MDFTQRYPSVRAPCGRVYDQERTSISAWTFQQHNGPIQIWRWHKNFSKPVCSICLIRFEMIGRLSHWVNKKKFIFFEFDSGSWEATGRSSGSCFLRYTYIHTLWARKALVFSFKCPRRQKEEWQKLQDWWWKASRWGEGTQLTAYSAQLSRAPIG